MSNSNNFEWSVLPLGSFIGPETLFSDGDWVESKDQDAQGRNRLIQLADIGDGNFLDRSDRNMNDEQFSRLRCTELREGDILIARMPDPLGRACLFPVTNHRCATVVDVAILRSPRADRDWLLYALNSVQSRRQIETLSAGTTRIRISRNLLAKVCFPTPPHEVQQTIASILRLVDVTIKKTEALIQKYQQIKAGLMHDLFTRGIGADGKLRPPREEAPELYQQTVTGWIPKEWEIKILESLLAKVSNNLRSGPFGSALLKSELVENGIPFLGIDNIYPEHFNDSFKRFVSENKFLQLSKYAVRANDVVITIMGTVGRAAIIPAHVTRALSSKHLWTMTFDPELVQPELICWQLNSSAWVESWFRKHSQGGIMDAIQSRTLRELKLPVPPRNEQKLIHERYLSSNENLKTESDILIKLKKQKSGLMQDLLTGKVSVNIIATEQATT